MIVRENRGTGSGRERAGSGSSEIIGSGRNREELRKLLNISQSKRG